MPYARVLLLDPYIGTDGSIRSYTEEDFSLDNIKPGWSLLFLWQATGERYPPTFCHPDGHVITNQQ